MMDVGVWFSICFLFYHMTVAECTSVLGKLLFASRELIMELDVDSKNISVLVNYAGCCANSLDYDYKHKYIYFTRNDYSMTIMRFTYPSQNISLQTFVNSSSFPGGVAVDSANYHVYWVHDNGDTLSRCNLDGTNVVVLNSSSHTFSIRLDVQNRWMYIGYQYTGISKSRFDLTDISMIVNFTSNAVAFVSCMDIDVTEQRVYWMNYYGDLKSVNVDGSDIKTIVSTNFPSYDYRAIGVSGDYIYYADNNKQLIMMNKSQGSTPTVLFTADHRIDSIYVFESPGI